jgi:hypothetical protein
LLRQRRTAAADLDAAVRLTCDCRSSSPSDPGGMDRVPATVAAKFPHGNPNSTPGVVDRITQTCDW